MAAKKGGKTKAKPAKTKEKKPAYKISSAYKVEGDKLIKKKSCPKCGKGVFLAEHKDRLSCGKCSYMEKKAKA